MKENTIVPCGNRILREESGKDPTKLAAVQRPLGADVAPSTGAWRLEHPDMRLGSVPDVHVGV